mmetsp:Transcript_21686/g.55376  ORF Transcript_21686/g.55376 Transcript_21686/m.55376 type:complete len:202 (-) Transcript_21686:326-931(-)
MALVRSTACTIWLRASSCALISCAASGSREKTISFNTSSCSNRASAPIVAISSSSTIASSTGLFASARRLVALPTSSLSSVLSAWGLGLAPYRFSSVSMTTSSRTSSAAADIACGLLGSAERLGFLATFVWLDSTDLRSSCRVPLTTVSACSTRTIILEMVLPISTSSLCSWMDDFMPRGVSGTPFEGSRGTGTQTTAVPA